MEVLSFLVSCMVGAVVVGFMIYYLQKFSVLDNRLGSILVERHFTFNEPEEVTEVNLVTGNGETKTAWVIPIKHRTLVEYIGVDSALKQLVVQDIYSLHQGNLFRSKKEAQRVRDVFMREREKFKSTRVVSVSKPEE